MGKRQPYWGYVKSILKDYPHIKREIETPFDPHITVTFNRALRSSDHGDPDANCVVHGVDPRKQRKFDAVQNAIYNTFLFYPETVDDRIKVVSLVYFKQSHTI